MEVEVAAGTEEEGEEEEEEPVVPTVAVVTLKTGPKLSARWRPRVCAAS